MNNINYSKIYSPHKIGIFEKCPKEYHYTYLDPRDRSKKYELQKLPENIWSFQTLGSAVHDAITLFYHQPPEERSRGVLQKNLKKTWRNFDSFKYYDQLPLGWRGGFETIEEERNAYRKAQTMLKNFYQLQKPQWKIFRVPTQNFKNSIEDYKKLIQPLNSSFDISGKFDLIIEEENGLHVIDFKTGREDGSDSFQLRFYKILAEKNFKRPVVKTSYFFLKKGKKQEKNMVDVPSAKIEREIREKIKKIDAAKSFEPQPSKLCNYCLFRKVCPQGPENKNNQPAKQETNDDLPF